MIRLIKIADKYQYTVDSWKTNDLGEPHFLIKTDNENYNSYDYDQLFSAMRCVEKYILSNLTDKSLFEAVKVYILKEKEQVELQLDIHDIMGGSEVNFDDLSVSNVQLILKNAISVNNFEVIQNKEEA